MCSLLSGEDYWTEFEREVRDLARLLSGESMYGKGKEGRAEIRRRATKYVLWEGRLFRRASKTLVIAIDVKDRQGAVKSLHDEPGYRGVKATVARISARFWWPGVQSDVSNYGTTYEVCQRMKSISQYLTSRKIPRCSLFEVFSIDFSGSFPKSTSGNQLLVIFIEHLTGWPIVKATAPAETVKGFIKKLILITFRITRTDRKR